MSQEPSPRQHIGTVPPTTYTALLEYAKTLEGMVIELRSQVNHLTPPGRAMPYADLYSDIFEIFYDYPAYEKFKEAFIDPGAGVKRPAFGKFQLPFQEGVLVGTEVSWRLSGTFLKTQQTAFTKMRDIVHIDKILSELF